jgi:hypothetical protein
MATNSLVVGLCWFTARGEPAAMRRRPARASAVASSAGRKTTICWAAMLTQPAWWAAALRPNPLAERWHGRRTAVIMAPGSRCAPWGLTFC